MMELTEFSEKDVKKGTTTLGMVCKDGVVLAAERRATMGTLIAHKTTKKIFKLDNNMGLTTAGLVGDLQILARYITAEVELYKLKRNAPMPIKSTATLTSNILSGRRYFPYWVQLIIGGVDSDGNHVYSLDMAGGSLPDDYVTTGSGSPYVYGVLEDHYAAGLDVKTGIDLAIRALSVAIKRDAASGDGIDVVTITKKGYTQLDDREVQKRKNAMKLT
jgi:proteasome beta subunit